MKHLLSPFKIRQTEFRNRIFSTGHMARMTANGLPTDQMIAYHQARAAGGTGLIITEAARVHESALSDAPAIDASSDRIIAPYRKLAQSIQNEGCKIFGQVSHSGRVNDRRRGGLRHVPYSASATPDERFHNMPRAMNLDLIEEVIQAYADAAGRFAKAGLDGIEVPASHGLLPAQFLNPRVNKRLDLYGGDLTNRLRFLTNILYRIRETIGESLVLGIRISIDELEHDGLEPGETGEICKVLNDHPALDYFNVIAGSMAGLAGSVHVVPPMMIDNAYTAPLSQSIKQLVEKPVFVAGRINQPQIAEQILDSDQADMCGMTRALISDPEMPNKTMANQLDDIRACIACNQACIGHYHLGTAISCIQNPTTGRELELTNPPPAKKIKKVAIAGAGPAGLKAAVTAAESGHQVTLCESETSIGGQVNLAQLIPGRSEFGGLITNLAKEAERVGVTVLTNTHIDKTWLDRNPHDAVIIATGATPYSPELEGIEDEKVINAWEALKQPQSAGKNVVIADWRADWVGMGTAELLARQGCTVRLAVNGPGAGQEIQSYVRDHWLGTLHKLGVEIIPYMRLFGFDTDTVYMQHILSNEPVIFEEVDTLVLAQGHQSETGLEQSLENYPLEVQLAGDCLSPRSAEEAVYEGMMAALRLNN